MSFYEKLPAELKLKIWKEAAYEHGMHHFRFIEDRYNDLARGHPMNTQLLKILPAQTADKSAWRARNNASRMDAFSWDAVEKFMKGEAAKLLYPLYPVPSTRANRSGSAMVHLDNDLICVQFAGMIMATWIRPLALPDMLTGIKRVALEYTEKGPGYSLLFPSNPFRCRCEDRAHRDDFFCPTTVDDFITYFPDLEKLYFIIKIKQTGSIIPPPTPSLPVGGKKRDYEGNVKPNARQPLKRRLTRAQAKKKLYSDTTERIKATAQRENLAYYEDIKFEYFEAKEEDAEKLVFYEPISTLFTGLEDLWQNQEATQFLPHPVHRVALGVIVYFDKPKPAATKK
ncbi:hypothetical protein K449DRAFT_452323 [Hypoxylon sp. EC38]|nr:hypothetical protein K449DRAFT_452323 [Hypoxylon sp. EC38]